MRNATVERTVAAPRSTVRALLADSPNIADWNDGVLNSYAIGDAAEGVGAPYCPDDDAGYAEELRDRCGSPNGLIAKPNCVFDSFLIVGELHYGDSPAAEQQQNCRSPDDFSGHRGCRHSQRSGPVAKRH